MSIPVMRIHWLFLMLVALAGIQVHAEPEPASQPAAIRVVLDDNYPPYSFRDSSGRAQGILKDLWDLWQQRTGVAVDFRPMEWGKARATMESGQADVIDTIFATEERRKIYDFSQPYAKIEVPIFFHRSIGGITDAASLRGFTVGVKEGDACVDYLKAHGVADLKAFASYEAQVKAAVRQEIRVLCIDRPPAFYFFHREGAADEFRHSPPLYVGEFHWAVTSGRADLKRLVEDGFSRISAAERAAIETRWLGEKFASVYWPGLVRYGGFALLAVALALIALFAWNWSLRRRVAARTAELELAHGASRESEARYRALTDLSSDWYWEQDENLRFTRMSKPDAGQSDIELDTFLGHTRRDAPGIIWDEPELARLEAITAAHGPFRDFELCRIYRNGDKHYVRMSGEPMFDASGAFKGYRGVGTDITARRKAEESLRESRALTDAVVENAPLMIFLKEATELRFVIFNRAGEELVGYDRRKILGRNNLDLFPPEQAARFMATDREVLDGDVGVLDIPEEPIMTARNGLRLIHTRKVCVRGADGKTKYLLGISEDITERKRAETAHRQLEAQLRESQKMEALGTLAGGVAHDFNNALAIIGGNVELARQDVGPGHVALESLEEIDRANRRAKDLVQQILAFSRRQTLERKPTTLSLVVLESARLLRAGLPANVSLNVDCKADTPAVLADAAQVNQILLNLGSNALQAVQDKARPGVIDISLEDHAQTVAHGDLRAGRYARLTVRDNGMGMNETTRERIFEPFFTTKPVGQGTGLGLSVVYNIVRSHDATMEVESTPGVGSVFRIYFPAVQAPVADVVGQPPNAIPAHGKGRRILYVDDESSLVLLMKRILERQGYRVSGYTDPREAIESVRTTPDQFDLVVTDYNMPHLTGLEVASAIGAIRPDLPVLLASGYVTDELRVKATEAGIRELIYKPNTVDELCAAVERFADAQTDGETPVPS